MLTNHSEQGKTPVLDPSLQMELKKANRTVTLICLCLLSDPFIYIIIAFGLKQMAGFDGVQGTSESLHVVRFACALIFVTMIANAIFVRKSLLSPERIAPAGADAKMVGTLYSRNHMIIGAIATAPAVVGLVWFVIRGNTDLLIVLSVASIALQILAFPRYEALEKVVLAKVMQGETLQAAHTEFH